MKQMKKISVILAVLLIIACQASANSVGLTGVSITPSQISNTDPITFNISGWAGHTSSWVDHDVFSQNGTSLQLDVYIDMGDLGAFSYWYDSKPLQPLSQGTYSLEVRAFDAKPGSPFYGTVQDTRNASFTVTPEPATLLLLGLGGLILRKRS
jgi:hypothetical protein